MKSFFRTKIAAVLLLGIVVAVIVVTFQMRTHWWMFCDLFLAFMAAFCRLMSLTLGKLNPIAGMKLRFAALVFGILFVIAAGIEYWLYTTAA